ncbi:MAG: alpha/beta fold hydrolase [Holosporales bacterium]
MSVLLLLHGGMQGGWCWERLCPHLEAHGHSVLTPCLEGQGTKAHLHAPGVSLSRHIEEVITLMDDLSLQDVILVGHSYGGMVATGVADQRPHLIQQILYLDAVVALPGQSMSTAIFPEVWQVLLDKANAEGEGWQVPAMHFEEYGFETEADRAFAVGKSTPQSMACFTEALFYDPSLHQKITSRYVHCRRSIFLNNMISRCEDMGIPVDEVEAGHFLMIEAPEFLATYLMDHLSQR